jgi:hypothetical protein
MSNESENKNETVDPIRGQVIYGIRHSPVNGELEKFTTDTKGVLSDVNSGAGFGDMEYLYLTEVERDTKFDEMASEWG